MQFLDLNRSVNARCHPLRHGAIIRMVKRAADAGMCLPVPQKLPE
jgi:hypothetical protein